MADLVTFGPGGIRPKTTVTVEVKDHWLDPWISEPYLHSLECVWGTAPAMPNATLVWQYGPIVQTDAGVFADYVKRTDLDRVFVRVSYETDGDGEDRQWYGVIELNNDQLGGARILEDASYASGRQVFSAYGLEYLLAAHEVIDARTDIGGPTPIVDVAPTFNAGGRPNKTPGELTFANDPDDSEHWSSRTIVEYLLEHQTPKNIDSVALIPFSLVGTDIPDWDQPQLDQAGHTTYALLDQLINRRRLLLWHLRVNDTTIELHTDTMIADPLTLDLPGAAPIAANKKQVHLAFDTDQLTSGVVKSSDVERVDQVIVRGARRRSVASFSAHKDHTIEPGWTPEDEDEYTQGAQQTQGYGALGPREKRKRDEEARTARELTHVFAFFRIPKTWDRKVQDGEGGGGHNPMFPFDPFGFDLLNSFPVFYPDMQVEQTTPLIDGVDYSGDKIASGSFELPEQETQEMPPLVVAKVPDEERWIRVDEIGKNADLEITDPENEFNRWSASVRVPPQSKGVYLDVHGSPRHVLDAVGFAYLDTDEKLGRWSFRDPEAGIIFTLSIPDDRYCEGRWPEELEATKSYTLRKLIQAGDGFRKDYVAPGTVVGVAADGKLKRTDAGGFIPKEADDDDQHRLIAAAKVAAAWYTITHYVLSLHTARIKPIAEIDVGYLVAEIGDAAAEDGHRQEINSPITEIRISSPLGEPATSLPIEMAVTTWAGELDPLLLPPPARISETESPADAADVDRSMIEYFGYVPSEIEAQQYLARPS